MKIQRYIIVGDFGVYAVAVFRAPLLECGSRGAAHLGGWLDEVGVAGTPVGFLKENCVSFHYTTYLLRDPAGPRNSTASALARFLVPKCSYCHEDDYSQNI